MKENVHKLNIQESKNVGTEHNMWNLDDNSSIPCILRYHKKMQP
jgi:hypothetical protein